MGLTPNCDAARGPRLDPLAMPPEELARLRAEGYGHLIAPEQHDTEESTARKVLRANEPLDTDPPRPASDAAKRHESGRYRTIVADPPWDHSDGTGVKLKTGFGRTQRELVGGPVVTGLPYQTMTLDEIKMLPVGDLANPDGCHLYLWVTNRYLRHAWDVAEAWGFKGVCVLVWCKESRGWLPGGAWPSNVEFILYAKRGKQRCIGGAQSRWFLWPRTFGPSVREGEKRQGGHSVKPEAFLDEVSNISPGPYLELFARRNRLGWDTWGDQALNHVEISA